MFRILTNLAKTRAARGALGAHASSAPADEDGPAVDPDRFRAPGDDYPHNWTPVGAPAPWSPAGTLGRCRRDRPAARAGLAGLPERQRAVVTLRDVHGLSSEEVCATLDFSAANQRVLLHRAERDCGPSWRATTGERGGDVMTEHPRTGTTISCQEVVELVTDYLEGARRRDARRAGGASRPLPGWTPISNNAARPSASLVMFRSTPCSDQAQQDLVGCLPHVSLAGPTGT